MNEGLIGCLHEYRAGGRRASRKVSVAIQSDDRSESGAWAKTANVSGEAAGIVDGAAARGWNLRRNWGGTSPLLFDRRAIVIRVCAANDLNGRGVLIVVTEEES